MRRRRNLIDKVAKKKLAGVCHFCNMEEYAALQVHRIIHGQQGGTYTEMNTIVTCANCHTLIHNGQIVIDRKYQSSSGRWILHYWENGIEKWR